MLRLALTTISFNGMSDIDAEHLLAALWCALEEHGLATPLLRVGSVNGATEITLTFRSHRDRALALANVGPFHHERLSYSARVRGVPGARGVGPTPASEALLSDLPPGSNTPE